MTDKRQLKKLLGVRAFTKALDVEKFTENYIQEHESDYIYPKPISVFLLTWNIASEDVIESLKKHLEKALSGSPDLICLGFQEVDMSLQSIVQGESVDRSLFEFEVYNALPSYQHYYILQSKHFGGISAILFAKNSFKAQVRSAITTFVSLGPLSMANKGAVSASIITRKASICFVNAHLPAHHKYVNARNEAYAYAVSRLRYKHPGQSEMGVLDHDFTYFFGDLNYRIDQDFSEIPKFSDITPQDISRLLESDQLLNSKKSGKAFEELTEPAVTFRPTFKMVPQKDLVYDSKRLPSWTDRIFYKSREERNSKALVYTSLEEPSPSDHLPVYGRFENTIDIYDSEAFCRVVNEAYAETAKKLAERQPRAELSVQDINFGDLHIFRKVERTITVTNTGLVDLVMLLTGNPLCYPANDSWLTFKVSLTVLKTGKSTELTFTAYIDEEVSRTLPLPNTDLEVLLVLKLTGGRQYFLTFNATYVRSCFGHPLELLVRTETPLKAGGYNTLKHITYSLPIQVASMTSYITGNLSTAKGPIFQNASPSKEVMAVIDMLDYDRKMCITDVPVESVTEALLLYLKCLPKKIISLGTIINPENFNNEPFDSLLSPYDALLKHLLVLFNTTTTSNCKSKSKSKLIIEHICKIAEPIIFAPEALKFLKVAPKQEKITGARLLHLFSLI